MTKSITLVYGPPDYTHNQRKELEQILNDRFAAMGLEFMVLPHGTELGQTWTVEA